MQLYRTLLHHNFIQSNPRPMKKYFVSFIVFLIIISFNSCEDKDDGTIRFYTALEYDTTPLTKPKPRETNGFIAYSRNFNTQKPSVEIRGGDGNYTFQSSDQEVIHNSSIYVDFYESDKRKFIFFTPLKEGSTIITVTDGKGLSAKLQVTVNTSTSNSVILESKVIMNDEVSQSVRKEIETDIAENHLSPYNQMRRTYTGQSEGNFVAHIGSDIMNEGYIEDNAPSTLRFKGTFLEKKNEYDYLETLSLIYDGQTRSYSLCDDRIRNMDWKISSRHYGIDLTDHYKAKYPAENIIEVYYALGLF